MTPTLPRLRKLCLALPDVTEKSIFDHPTFRIGGKMFCMYHGYADAPAIAFKVAKTEQGIFLDDPRFYRTPHLGHHGWVSLKDQGRLNWKEIEELVSGSYLLTAPRARVRRKS